MDSAPRVLPRWQTRQGLGGGRAASQIKPRPWTCGSARSAVVTAYLTLSVSPGCKLHGAVSQV